MRRRQPSLFALSSTIFQLGLEAQQVVGLRMAKAVFGGPAAEVENSLMVSEKIAAAFEVQAAVATAVMTGQAHLAPGRALSLYRRKVRANRRRLLKG